MSNIKIFTSYHKKCELLKNKYIYPIQVGTDVNGIIYEDTLHDNTGDNISGKNGMYCELTAQYWAGKTRMQITMALCIIAAILALTRRSWKRILLAMCFMNGLMHRQSKI